jgi:hypothetical protein
MQFGNKQILLANVQAKTLVTKIHPSLVSPNSSAVPDNLFI